MADDAATPPTPAPAATPTPPDPAPAADAKGATVRLAVPHPYSTFDSGIEGVPLITAEGVDVPAKLATRVKNAYRAAFGVDEIAPTDNQLIVLDQEV